jgi:excisionase family DNA binding protein
MNGTYMTVEEAAAALRVSQRTIHELTRTARIPHRRPSGTRRCLLLRDELDAWLAGTPLEVTELPGGGRVVRPKA